MIKLTAHRFGGAQESLFNPKFIKLVRPSKHEPCAPNGVNSMLYMKDDELFYCNETVEEIEKMLKAGATE